MSTCAKLCMIFPLLFAVPYIVFGDVTMVKLFGKVPDLDLQNELTKSSEECMDDCFHSEDCILVFMDTDSHCLQLDYADYSQFTVVETSSPDGFTVGIKTVLPDDTCPVSYEQIKFVSLIESEQMTWLRTSDEWSLKKCEGDWKRFERADDVVVCMQGFPLPRGSSLVTAKELCSEKGHVVTGVASVEECLWLQKKLVELYPSVEKWLGFWVDGEKDCTTGKGINCRSFKWSDGYTTGNGALAEEENVNFSGTDQNRTENCLSVAVTTVVGTKTLNDASCESFGSAVGVACGYRLQ